MARLHLEAAATHTESNYLLQNLLSPSLMGPSQMWPMSQALMLFNPTTDAQFLFYLFIYFETVGL